MPTADGTGSNQAVPGRPIQVTSATFHYREAESLLTYTGDVRVEQEGRTLDCEELKVELDADREAKTMTCTGKARLADPVNGRTVAGERAMYHVQERQVEMFGEPVILVDRAGNKVRGRHLVYFMEDGRVEVKGEGSESSPAAPKGTGG